MQAYKSHSLTHNRNSPNKNIMISAAAVAAAAAAANQNDISNNYHFGNLQNHHHHHQQHPHQQQQANHQYQQELVKSYLNQHQQQQQQQTSNSVMSPVSSSNHSLALAAATAASAGSAQQQQQQQTSPNGSMASFAARLMSLNPYEVKCLNADNELMKRISETQSLMESRLHDINNSHNNNSNINNNGNKNNNSASGAVSNHNRLIQQQQVINNIQQQQQLNKLYQQHLSSTSPLGGGIQMKQPLQEQQQQFLLSSQQQSSSAPNNNYYQNYYAQQLMLAQHHMAQQIQQQQLYLQLNNRVGSDNSNALNNLINVQQSPTNTTITSMSTNNSSPTIDSKNKDHNKNSGANQSNDKPQQRSNLPALDLRTTPTRPISVSPLSPVSSRAGSTGSAASCSTRQQQQHPKKMKLSEYRKQNDYVVDYQQQQQNTIDTMIGRTNPSLSSPSEQYHHHQHHLNKSTSNASNGGSGSNNVINTNTSVNDHESNYNKLLLNNHSNNTSVSNKRPHSSSGNSANENLLATACDISQQGGSPLHQQQHQQSINLRTTSNRQLSSLNCNDTTIVIGNAGNNNKKYKGEFDEPSPDEVAQRQLQLNKPDHYHRHALERGECACVIGSEFRDKTKQEAIQLLENWRSLDIAERIKYKWDVNDLPKDIPLSDIKKYEDLRRDFSSGRADFGGASKRKPLGIRGTRQFLLMLYCLWGHPGREDPMQQDGYCPHCFARIRTENEQSTLVRVVNHFNMKHRRGANPRLSPRLEAANQSTSLTHNVVVNTNSKPTSRSVSSISSPSPSPKQDSIVQSTDTNQGNFSPSQSSKSSTQSAKSNINDSGIDPQSPHLEVARTLLSMVESAAKDASDLKLKSPSSTSSSSEMVGTTDDSTKQRSAAGCGSKSPEMDSENLDPRSVATTNDESEGAVTGAGSIVDDDEDTLPSQDESEKVIKKEITESGNKVTSEIGINSTKATTIKKDSASVRGGGGEASSE